MDDFNLSSLSESRNEWVSRLMNTMTPYISEGFKEIFNEAFKLCVENQEEDKYLMTFQNFISRIPKWNDELLTNEVNRIIESSSCGYLEDLITCVHIIQLKALTCIRVGQKQKKVDIDIPKLKDFVHKVYILVARKLYSNIYLFEKDIPPLLIQKNNREFELIVKDSVVNAIRESIPVEQILRSYLDETTEEDVEVEQVIEEENAKLVGDSNTITREVTEIIEKDDSNKDQGIKLKTSDNLVISKDNSTVKLDSVENLEPEKENEKDEKNVKLNIVTSPEPPSLTPLKDDNQNISISFNDIDKAVSPTGKEEEISAPKDIERLENIATEAAEKRRLEEMEDMADDEKLIIGEPIKLDDLSSSISTNNDLVKLDGVEVLA